jgi:transcriptional regulator of arginine metabolism
LNRRQRQQLIERVLRDAPVSSQLDVVAALAAAGCEVTQATVSRDLREMGFQAWRDGEGRVRYVQGPVSAEKPDAAGACGRMLREFGRGVQVAQNLLVLRCDPGAAPGLGRVVDELDHELVLGCVAGDDTLIMVCRDSHEAETVCGYLRELGG